MERLVVEEYERLLVEDYGKISGWRLRRISGERLRRKNNINEIFEKDEKIKFKLK